MTVPYGQFYYAMCGRTHAKMDLPQAKLDYTWTATRYSKPTIAGICITPLQHSLRGIGHMRNSTNVLPMKTARSICTR